MVQKPVHYRVEHQPRAGEDSSWEVFVRDDADDQLRHVGTLPAPSERQAYDRARRLFGWFVHDIWLTPAADVGRFSADPPSPTAEPVDPENGEESRIHEV
jgi:rSAM-partnered protein